MLIENLSGGRGGERPPSVVLFNNQKSSFNNFFSMTEVAKSGKEHGQAEAVGGCDDFGVALRAPGLDDGGGPDFGDFFHAVGEWEEGIGGGNRAFQRELSLHRANLGPIDAGP